MKLIFLIFLIFFHLLIKKVGFITLKMSKFQILKAYLWLIYFKKIEFIVYTFIFEALKNFSLRLNALKFWIFDL